VQAELFALTTVNGRFGPPVQLHNAERLATGWLAE